MTNKLNKTEKEKANLWDAGMYSQIIYFQNGRNKPCSLALTTTVEQHEMLINNLTRDKISHEAFYYYSKG